MLHTLKEARIALEAAGFTCSYRQDQTMLIVSASDKPDGTGGLREIRRFENVVSIYDIQELFTWKAQRK